MSLETLEIQEVLSLEDRRIRLDKYRTFMRMLDTHMVNKLSTEDRINPVWDAKVLFNQGLEEFGIVLENTFM